MRATAPVPPAGGAGRAGSGGLGSLPSRRAASSSPPSSSPPHPPSPSRPLPPPSSSSPSASSEQAFSKVQETSLEALNGKESCVAKGYYGDRFLRLLRPPSYPPAPAMSPLISRGACAVFLPASLWLWQQDPEPTMRPPHRNGPTHPPTHAHTPQATSPASARSSASSRPSAGGWPPTALGRRRGG